MTARQSREEASAPPVEPPEPVNVVDGIPDRSADPAWRKTVVLLAIFFAWVAFLVVCLLLGSP